VINKMMIFLLLAMLFFPLRAYCEQVNRNDTLNRKDANGLKQGRFIERKSWELYISGFYKHDLKEGCWTIYHVNEDTLLPEKQYLTCFFSWSKDSIGYVLFMHYTIREYRVRPLPRFYGDTALTAFARELDFCRDSVRIYTDLGKLCRETIYVRNDISLHFPTDLLYGGEGGPMYDLSLSGKNFTMHDRFYDKATGQLVNATTIRLNDEHIDEQDDLHDTDK